MNGLWGIAALVAVWIALQVAGKPLIAALAGRMIGERALAKQPDTISLTRRGDDAWRDLDAARRMWQPLDARGFADAGTYSIDEIRGVVLRLLASPREHLMAIAYEHPVAGRWIEVATRYQDGTGHTVTSMAATGLDDRPGHPVIAMSGATAEQLIERALRERPVGHMQAVRADDVAHLFEQVYAESMAWRKTNGISQREVVKVVLRKAA